MLNIAVWIATCWSWTPKNRVLVTLRICRSYCQDNETGRALQHSANTVQNEELSGVNPGTDWTLKHFIIVGHLHGSYNNTGSAAECDEGIIVCSEHESTAVFQGTGPVRHSLETMDTCAMNHDRYRPTTCEWADQKNGFQVLLKWFNTKNRSLFPVNQACLYSGPGYFPGKDRFAVFTTTYMPSLQATKPNQRGTKAHSMEYYGRSVTTATRHTYYRGQECVELCFHPP